MPSSIKELGYSAANAVCAAQLPDINIQEEDHTMKLIPGFIATVDHPCLCVCHALHGNGGCCVRSLQTAIQLHFGQLGHRSLGLCRIDRHPSARITGTDIRVLVSGCEWYLRRHRSHDLLDR